jgi:hypothetical protein
LEGRHTSQEVCPGSLGRRESPRRNFTPRLIDNVGIAEEIFWGSKDAWLSNERYSRALNSPEALPVLDAALHDHEPPAPGVGAGRIATRESEKGARHRGRRDPTGHARSPPAHASTDRPAGCQR